VVEFENGNQSRVCGSTATEAVATNPTAKVLGPRRAVDDRKRALVEFWEKNINRPTIIKVE
jgi:hypothetical protein